MEPTTAGALTALLDEFAALLATEIAEHLAKTSGKNLNELLTPYQVARELKVAPKQVKRLIAERTLRTVEDMKHWLVGGSLSVTRPANNEDRDD